jgi:hypothetical protein
MSHQPSGKPEVSYSIRRTNTAVQRNILCKAVHVEKLRIFNYQIQGPNNTTLKHYMLVYYQPTAFFG